MTQDKAQELFMAAMRCGPDIALYTSFRKYSTQRDALIAQFAASTGFPESLFEDAITQRQINELINRHAAEAT